MKNLEDYIESGIIEMYVLGLTTDEENKEIQNLCAIYPEINTEITEVSEALMGYKNNQVNLNPSVKPMLMATIDYTERLKNGERPSVPPMLTENSQPVDFSEWTNRQDMHFDEDYGDTFAKIIGYTPEALTAIVWMKELAPYEVHDKQYEKLLVLEGACDIIMQNKVISLSPGDFYAIPLHTGHTIKITSAIPCKIILQRVAA